MQRIATYYPIPEEDPIECENPDVYADAYEMYEALEGWGTDEDAIYEILHRNRDPECIMELYMAFEDVLEREDDTEDGDLIKWLRDDGEEASANYVYNAVQKMTRAIKQREEN